MTIVQSGVWVAPPRPPSISHTGFWMEANYITQTARQDLRLASTSVAVSGHSERQIQHDGDHHEHQNLLHHHLHQSAGSGFWATVTDWRFINSTKPHTENVGHKRGAGSRRGTLGQRQADNTLQCVEQTHKRSHTYTDSFFYQAHPLGL